MPRVFILTEGGKDIGYGHIARCISVSQAFRERKIKVRFIVNAEAAVRNLLEDEEFELFDWTEERKRLFGLLQGADVAIVDSYLGNLELYRDIAERVKVPVYFDDNRRLEYPAGIVVNGNVYAEELDYPKKEDITYLLGSRYLPLRKEFFDVREKEVEDGIKSVMITFGGDDSKDMTPRVLDYLNRHCPEYRKNVIIGRAFHEANRKKIESLRNEKTVLFNNPGSDRMKEIMLESDLAISAGGLTLSEFARVGLPAVGVCVADNQERNLNGWQREGFIEYIGRHDDKYLLEKLGRSMERLADVNLRRERAEKGKNSVDGKGSPRIVRAILARFLKENISLRRADYSDAGEILGLSNDTLVRQNSFNPEKIEWEHHVRWLNNKLNDKNCVFFVAANDGVFCGQARFDIDPGKKEAVINISLAKDLRGMDLGSFLIKKSIGELLKVRNDVREIKACVKDENLPSLKAFEKADFRLLGDTVIKGNKARVFVREAVNAGV